MSDFDSELTESQMLDMIDDLKAENQKLKAELDERERKAIRFMVEWVSKHPTLIPKNVEALFEQYKKARGE